MTNNKMILVTGATGNVGGHVVAELVDRGVQVRALVRDPAKADFPSGVEVVRGDLAQPDTLDAALAGVSGVFLFAVPGSGPAFVDAATRNGVTRVVLLSSNAVDDTVAEQANPIAAYHAEIEHALRASTLEWTFLRSAHMASNTLPWAAQSRSGDVVRGPYAGPPAHRSTRPTWPRSRSTPSSKRVTEVSDTTSPAPNHSPPPSKSS